MQRGNLDIDVLLDPIRELLEHTQRLLEVDGSFEKEKRGARAEEEGWVRNRRQGLLD